MIIPKSCATYTKLQRTGGVDYALSIEQDYAEIQPYLPYRAVTVWDIGAGVGGIDVRLYHRYSNPSLYLTDYNTVDDAIYYGYKQKTAAYNSLDAAHELLTTNGVLPEDIYLDDLSLRRRARPIKADIVISLLSCGFHFPLAAYYKEILYRTEAGSILIVDLNKKDNTEYINKDFKKLAYNEHKYHHRFIGVRR